MANSKLTDLEGNGKKGVKTTRLYLAIFLFLFLTLPMGYYFWKRSHRNDLSIIERDEWGAEEPTAREYLNLPAQNVIIYHTATEQCETKDACIHRMQMLQDFHMKNRDWHDIGLNFLVGGDGGVYEGRGWDVRAQGLRGYESVSISIAFIGTFSNVEPRERQVLAAKRLMEDGVRRKKLRHDYSIYAQRQFEPTESPGQKLYDLMKRWPRWSSI
ncbi:peptidoglycan-recognition protein LF-like [Drosophila biarmipes]|uniref:peptidoglycan-recognition protein LF-like n=1 Tax=Drosophila biarmipes TaxID=125945 RepID=UPI001CDB2F29|nr:peptidoglycan-recognition protein LF-like [Drosophila biarmipes]